MKENSIQPILDRIGLRITELRKKKGYTSHETFAFDYDLPRMQYWRIERGKSNITLKSLNKILSTHEITIEEFFMNLK